MLDFAGSARERLTARFFLGAEIMPAEKQKRPSTYLRKAVFSRTVPCVLPQEAQIVRREIRQVREDARQIRRGHAKPGRQRRRVSIDGG
jgi:hypothetical protein